MGRKDIGSADRRGKETSRVSFPAFNSLLMSEAHEGCCLGMRDLTDLCVAGESRNRVERW